MKEPSAKVVTAQRIDRGQRRQLRVFVCNSYREVPTYTPRASQEIHVHPLDYEAGEIG